MTENQADELKRQIFVAYPYRLFPKADYRAVFEGVSDDYAVTFLFADEKITNMHILQKIISYIRASDFSIFDISGWNPNVTLELGIAMSSEEDWYISFNPTLTDLNEVPSDLRGIDRIEYASYTDYGDKLRALVEQRYPKRTSSIETFLDDIRSNVRDLLAAQPGLTMQELADVAGSTVAVMQLAVRPMVGTELRTTGRTKAMKYFLTSGDASVEPSSA